MLPVPTTCCWRRRCLHQPKSKEPDNKVQNRVSCPTPTARGIHSGVSAFHPELGTSGVSVSPLPTRDQLERDQFTDGLADRDTRRNVVPAYPKSLDDAVRAALKFEIASRDAAMPTTEKNNALRTASHPLNLIAVLKANTTAMKEVIGALHDLTAARQTDSSCYSRRENSRFSAQSGRGSRLSEVICRKSGQSGHVQAVCTNTSR